MRFWQERKIFFTGSIFVAFFVFLWYGIVNRQSSHANINQESRHVNEQAVTLNGQRLNLETMRTPQEHLRGLSGRLSLESDRGMLFLFTEPDYYKFWMKDMHVPLDIIWIREGRVVDIAQSLPPPRNKDDSPASHDPLQKADQVLELLAGGSKRYGLVINGQARFVY